MDMMRNTLGVDIRGKLRPFYIVNCGENQDNC